MPSEACIALPTVHVRAEYIPEQNQEVNTVIKIDFGVLFDVEMSCPLTIMSSRILIVLKALFYVVADM